MGKSASKNKKKKQKVKNDPKKKKVAIKKREKAKYPGLEKQLFSRIKQEYHDYDYIDKLSDAEKQWLSDFTGEWLGANLNDSGKKMHKSNKRRKQVFDMNNSRNRDIISHARAGGLLDDVSVLDAEEIVDPSGYEDAFLDQLDSDPELLDAFIDVLKDKGKG